MFDIGFSELVLVGVIALLVIGPEKLPHTLRMVTAYTGRIKRAINDLKYELEKEVEVQEVKQRLQNEINSSGLTQLKQNLETDSPVQNSTLATKTPPTETEAPSVPATDDPRPDTHP
jgi:sec-independent protein translocase protein TatB